MGCGESKDKTKANTQYKVIPKYKVIVVGDSDTGKTAIIHQYVNG